MQIVAICFAYAVVSAIAAVDASSAAQDANYSTPITGHQRSQSFEAPMAVSVASNKTAPSHWQVLDTLKRQFHSNDGTFVSMVVSANASKKVAFNCSRVAWGTPGCACLSSLQEHSYPALYGVSCIGGTFNHSFTYNVGIMFDNAKIKLNCAYAFDANSDWRQSNMTVGNRCPATLLANATTLSPNRKNLSTTQPAFSSVAAALETRRRTMRVLREEDGGQFRDMRQCVETEHDATYNASAVIAIMYAHSDGFLKHREWPKKIKTAIAGIRAKWNTTAASAGLRRALPVVEVANIPWCGTVPATGPWSPRAECFVERAKMASSSSFESMFRSKKGW